MLNEKSAPSGAERPDGAYADVIKEGAMTKFSIQPVLPAAMTDQCGFAGLSGVGVI